jgi:hypothetical protein
MSVPKRVIFPAEMVKATLDNRKNQFRVVANPQPYSVSPVTKTPFWIEGTVNIPYRGGDRLWVAEEWAWDDYGQRYWYAADRYLTWVGGWEPAETMPPEASRIMLEVTGNRPQQIQDITRTDIYAEGLFVPLENSDKYKEHLLFEWIKTWDSAHDYKDSWDSNPWVWVVDFQLVEGTSAAP